LSIKSGVIPRSSQSPPGRKAGFLWISDPDNSSLNGGIIAYALTECESLSEPDLCLSKHLRSGIELESDRAFTPVVPGWVHEENWVCFGWYSRAKYAKVIPGGAPPYEPS